MGQWYHQTASIRVITDILAKLQNVDLQSGHDAGKRMGREHTVYSVYTLCEGGGGKMNGD